MHSVKKPSTPEKPGRDGSNHRPVIGWRECISLPEWGIDHVIAKIDTGAKTTSIHAANIEELPGNRLRFDVVLSREHPAEHVTIETDIVRVARVRPSTGKPQERYVVETSLCLGTVEKSVELNLVCRKSMICRMLIGRAALGHDFLIDATASYLCSRPPDRRPVKRRKKKAKQS